jgi:hypothetical protein
MIDDDDIDPDDHAADRRVSLRARIDHHAERISFTADEFPVIDDND